MNPCEREYSCCSLGWMVWQEINSNHCPQGTGDFPQLSLFRKKHRKILKMYVEINCRVNKGEKETGRKHCSAGKLKQKRGIAGSVVGCECGCAWLCYTCVISLLSPHSSINKSQVLLVLFEDIGPVVSLPPSWAELHCGNVDLSWVDRGFFLSVYGQHGVPLSITAASMMKGSGCWMGSDFNDSIWNVGRLIASTAWKYQLNPKALLISWCKGTVFKLHSVV